MPVETATFIHDLNPADPQHTDGLNQADSHLRLIKTVLQSTFPNLTGAVNGTPAELNQAATANATPGTLEVAATPTSGAALTLDPIAGSGSVTFKATGAAGSDGGLTISIEDKTGANPITALTITRSGSVITAPTGVLNAGTIQQGGATLIPRGFIGLWVGSVASIPAGWALCNGLNSTPDLRNRFVIAAGGAYVPFQTGGAASTAAVTDAQGFHAHTGITAIGGPYGMTGAADVQGAHAHTGATTVAGAHAHGIAESATFVAGGQFGVSAADVGNTDVQGNHNHGIVTDGAHSHNIFVSNVPAHNHGIVADGTHAHNVAVNTMPPFYALCYIMKL